MAAAKAAKEAELRQALAESAKGDDAVLAEVDPAEAAYLYAVGARVEVDLGSAEVFGCERSIKIELEINKNLF